MIYMCGSSLESGGGIGRGGQATNAITDMITSRFDLEQVNVVLLLGGSSKWNTGLNGPDELTILEIGGGSEEVNGKHSYLEYIGGNWAPKIVTALELDSMGKSKTLTNFLDYCSENYPAEQYDLVIWDHGGGPVWGVCQDELFSDELFPKDSLMAYELAEALEESAFADHGLDLIIFDACLMGSAEIAYMLEPYAKYMVGSEDSIYGLSYRWLNGLEKCTALETAVRIADQAFERNGFQIKIHHSAEINSFSVVDLSAMKAVIHAMDDFFPAVLADMTDSGFSLMSNLRRKTVTFGISQKGDDSCYDLIDLGDINANYSDYDRTAAETLERAIQNAVVYKRSDDDGCSGLTVYHPYLNKKFMDFSIGVYNELEFSSGYLDYIHKFAAFLTGTPLAQWADLHPRAAMKKDLHMLFTLLLNEEQNLQFGDAGLVILQREDNGTYSFAALVSDVEKDSDGYLSGDYNWTSLYAVKKDGKALSFELEYKYGGNGTILIPAQLIRHAEDDSPDVIRQAEIFCVKDGDRLIPGAAAVWDDITNTYTPIFGGMFEDYDEVILTSVSREPVYSENGSLPGFEDWTETGRKECRLTIDDSWDFRFLANRRDTSSLYAVFRIADSQNNVYSSELLPLKNVGSNSDTGRLIYDDMDRLLITDIRCTRRNGKAILSGSLTNLLETETCIEYNILSINDKEIGISGNVSGQGPNFGLLRNETQTFAVQIPENQVFEEGMPVRIIIEFTLTDPVTGESLGIINAEISL